MSMIRFGRLAATLLILAACTTGATAQEALQVPEGVPSYKPTSGISGSLSSIGSDTMNNLMTLWQEGFRRHYPNVTIQVEGKGSSTAPPALISGTAQLGPMSRPMKSSEIDEFEKKFGYKPTEIRTSLDALAVYVHKDNPVTGFTLQQIDAIFSKTLAGGAPKSIDTWDGVGLGGDWARPISLYGRNSASGTYAFFKEHALFKGDYKDTVKEQPGSASVVQGVENDRYGIGYSGIGYNTAGVKAVPLGRDAESVVPADIEHVVDGTYPLGRFLYLYVNKPPNKPLDPLIHEFLKFVLSAEGQEVVIKDGYLPLPAQVVEEELTKLD
ncbi:MAG: phosphate ABC transporter substrate-binding protein PstS family protein [Candidatus Eisenbacteria bacterium]|nr:phosphate ABC transporter substrate-binding protein PstS family protein [Candidatus Latescibacterota bacterium]MBD3302626.1 phosphate ABC transporter substrate-binding protein PstS family protein [Candidatus Eisenbacteria bacterium]